MTASLLRTFGPSSAKRTRGHVLSSHTGGMRADQLIALATAAVLGGGVAVAATTTRSDTPSAAGRPASTVAPTPPSPTAARPTTTSPAPARVAPPRPPPAPVKAAP